MILIRADGNSRIGMGHLMRCMTIGEELALLQGSKAQICFVCADEASGEFARENGFPCYVLGTDYQDMESELSWWEEIRVKLEQEAFVSHVPGREQNSGCGELVSGQKDQAGKEIVILVDSYYVTDPYLAALGKFARTTLMDDMGTHCYPADCVINYNAPADPGEYRKLYQGSKTKLLIGSRYIPLRRQFRRYKTRAPECPHMQTRSGKQGTEEAKLSEAQVHPAETRKDAPAADSRAAFLQVREILITTGGGDRDNIAGDILKRIYDVEYSFHLVLGRFSPHFQKMKELEEKYDNIQIHCDVKDMAALMSRCQIAVTAGGSTIYELAALGVPFLCFSYAENQEALVQYIGDRHIAGSAGAWHKDPGRTLERIGHIFQKLAGDPALRMDYRRNEMRMVDGEGAGRLAREIIESGI